MEKTIMMTVDGSPKGFEAVGIVGAFMKDQTDAKLQLYHCVQQLTSLAPGEICTTDYEVACRLPEAEQEKHGIAVLNEARKRLQAAGFPESRVSTKLKVSSLDPAKDIMAEAESGDITTVAMGRRGRSQLQTLLLGSVSAKVAQYVERRSVWIVDTPVNQTKKVLVAMEGVHDSKHLLQYAANVLAPREDLEYTFLHIIPPVPPTFWDDGHILGQSEQTERTSRVDKWRKEWSGNVEEFMAEGKALLTGRGVPEKNVRNLIVPTREGVARDLLNEIEAHQFQLIVMGKRSFKERKPFLMGSHANKILQAAKGVILCMVDV